VRGDLALALMCLFMDMDKMVGGQFEKGLTNMSPWWKQRLTSSAATLDSGVVEFYYRNG